MGEVIVVIGAGQIGQAIARRVSAGKHVLLADLHQGSASAAAEILANAGFEVSTAAVDVSSRESSERWSRPPPRSGTSPGSSMRRASPPARRRQG